jgi:MoaA/NifB/PqqE/SkfB family radical SAM enzyme
MNIPHDKFCILPWVSLETSPIGTVRPCCLAEEEIKDELGNKYKLITTDLRTVHNSVYMRNLRQQFLRGKQPQTCRKCWNEERSGRTSKRMHTLNRLKHIVHDTEWTADAKPLMFLDLKLGNICNLKCRICGSWSSSQFAAEEIKFEGKDNIHYQMLRDGAWPRENHGFWQDVDTLLEDIRYIEFTGGEPFMISEHFDLLQGIVDRGIAHQVEIHYNTNGTHYPEHAESVWQHFKTVEIAFSIDDVGARFEYQRTNAVWTEVNKNIARFRELRSRSSNIQLQVCSTVNVFNVLYLEDLALWIDLQDFDFVYWNMLHEAYYLSVSTMPDTAKQLAIKQLTAADVDEPHRTEFDRIADFIHNGVSLDGSILRMKVADLDRRRQQNLFDDHSELANAIGYEGPI